MFTDRDAVLNVIYAAASLALVAFGLHILYNNAAPYEFAFCTVLVVVGIALAVFLAVVTSDYRAWRFLFVVFGVMAVIPLIAVGHYGLAPARNLQLIDVGIVFTAAALVCFVMWLYFKWYGQYISTRRTLSRY